MALENIPMLDANEVSRKITADLHTTDEYVQVVKIGFGADGTAPTLASAADPVPVEHQGVIDAALAASEEMIGATVGKLAPIRPAMTITAGAYAAGECVGGELALTNAMRIAGQSGTGMLHKLTLVDKANVKPELRCILFDSNPSGTYTDNGLPIIHSSDYARIIAELHIETTDWVTFDDGTTDFAIGTLNNLGELVASNGAADLFAVFIAVGTPTFTATDQLVPTFWFIQN